jgi:hypothetical protein
VSVGGGCDGGVGIQISIQVPQRKIWGNSVIKAMEAL